MRIFKYPIEITDEQVIEMPMDAKILTFQMQYNMPFIWALVNPALIKVRRKLSLFGTGNPIVSPVGIYIGTVQEMSGQLVWHLFDQGEVDE